MINRRCKYIPQVNSGYPCCDCYSMFPSLSWLWNVGRVYLNSEHKYDTYLKLTAKIIFLYEDGGCILSK